MKLENQEQYRISFFRSIRFRFIVWFFLVLFIPFTIGGMALYLYAKSTIQKNISSHLNSMADARIENAATFIDAKKGRTIDFSSDGFTRDMAELIGRIDYDGEVGKCMLDLGNHLKRNKVPLDPDILEIFIMDMEGEIIASSNPKHIMLGRPDADYFINAKRYGIYVTDLHRCMDADVTVIEMSRLLTSRKYEKLKPVGVIVNRIRSKSLINKLVKDPSNVQRAGMQNSDVFQPELNSGANEKGLNIKTYLIDWNNLIVGGSGISNEDVFKKTIYTEPVKRFDESGKITLGVYQNHLGENVIGTTRYLDDMDLLVLMEIDTKEAFAPLARVQKFIIILAPLVFLSIIGVAYLLSIRLSLPITRMTNLTRKIASGDLKGRLIISRSDEIGLLGKTFNKMQDEIRKRNEKLTAINEIGSVLPHSLDLNTTLCNIMDKMLDILKVKAVGIYLIDKEKCQLDLICYKGISEKMAKEIDKLKMGEGIFGSMAKAGKPIIVKDIASDKRLVRAIGEEKDFTSMAVVPLVSKKKVLGTLFVLMRDPQRFNGEDIEFFTTIGSEIGITIDNCLLFEQVFKGRKDWEDTFDAISDSICIVDNDFRILRVNKITTGLINKEIKELLGKNCCEVFYGTDTYLDKCPLRKCVASRKGESLEIYIEKLNKALYASVFPVFDKDGNISNFVHVTRDITEMKNIEERLRTSYKMASLGRLTAGVFHEVLNPLNIISSYVQLFLSEGKWGSKTERDLKKIQEEIKRIVKITDGLLRFSRKGETEVREIETNSLLEKVISIVEPDMKLENVRFIRRFEEGLPKIMANGDELRQVFLNLITNARDAMPEGGTLTISTQSVKKRRKPFVRIRFTDTGSGISKKDIDKVFDPFFTTKEEGKGTGLGLSTSYGIIDNHGGIMSVESEEGKGTTVTVDLPAKT